MNKLDEIKIRIAAIEVLRALKEIYSYEQLSKMLGLQIPVISRYINGHVLPGISRSEFILSKFGTEIVSSILKEKVEIIDLENKVFKITEAATDPLILKIASQIVFNNHKSQRIDKILTKETMGIPLATMIAQAFGVRLIVARNRKEMGVDKFIEVKRIFSSGTYSYLYVPRDFIKKRENIILIDDAIRTGSTMKALINICKVAGAKPLGAYSLISVGDITDKLATEFMFPVISFYRI